MPDDPIVLSVPAGFTYDLIQEHLIYSCPDTRAYQYRPTVFLTPRTGNGHMEKLFTVAQIVRLNPLDIRATFDISEEILDRIRGYLGVAQNKGVLEEPGFYRFYILDADSITPLPHNPQPTTRLQGAAYFRKSCLLSGDSYVTPEL
jgi:hypothetical protein